MRGNRAEGSERLHKNSLTYGHGFSEVRVHGSEGRVKKGRLRRKERLFIQVISEQRYAGTRVLVSVIIYSCTNHF